MRQIKIDSTGMCLTLLHKVLQACWRTHSTCPPTARSILISWGRGECKKEGCAEDAIEAFKPYVGVARISLTPSVDTRSMYRVEWEKPRISLTLSVDTRLLYRV